jgi:nicotinate-nucleotide adenylyltransferase
MKNLRIGLFGGSFDPVHCGHLLMARAAIEEAGLDRVVFIPTATSPFKPDSNPAPAAARLRMLRLALAGEADCEVDDQEIRRGGVSYTIDTVKSMAERQPGAKLFWLIGADQVWQLPEWREAEELARLVEFLIIPRPSENAPELLAGFHGRVLKGFPFGVSSTEIRERARSGKPLTHLVPAAVAEAIRNNRLYL